MEVINSHQHRAWEWEWVAVVNDLFMGPINSNQTLLYTNTILDTGARGVDTTDRISFFMVLTTE